MIELLINQGLAMIEMNNLNKNQVVSISLTNDLKAIYRTIQKWIDISDEKVFFFFFKFIRLQLSEAHKLRLLNRCPSLLTSF